MRAWSYVMTYDGGSAPNFDPPATTLVVCKPRIRSKARPGDLVLGFNGKPLATNPHSLRWAGVVSEIIPMERYWEDPRFSGKRPGNSPSPDNFYRLEESTWIQEPNSTHAGGDVQRDLSGQNALVFEDSWYFADTAPELPPIFELRVTANRRNEPLRLIEEGEWRALRTWLVAHDQRTTAIGRDNRTKCNAKPTCRAATLAGEKDVTGALLAKTRWHPAHQRSWYVYARPATSSG